MKDFLFSRVGRGVSRGSGAGGWGGGDGRIALGGGVPLRLVSSEPRDFVLDARRRLGLGRTH
jgi:hypothetical protein